VWRDDHRRAHAKTLRIVNLNTQASCLILP
jgi:ribosomal protein L32